MDVLERSGNRFALSDGTGEVLAPGASPVAPPTPPENGGDVPFEEPPKLLVDLMIGQVYWKGNGKKEKKKEKNKK